MTDCHSPGHPVLPVGTFAEIKVFAKGDSVPMGLRARSNQVQQELTR